MAKPARASFMVSTAVTQMARDLHFLQQDVASIKRQQFVPSSPPLQQQQQGVPEQQHPLMPPPVLSLASLPATLTGRPAQLMATYFIQNLPVVHKLVVKKVAMNQKEKKALSKRMCNLKKLVGYLYTFLPVDNEDNEEQRSTHHGCLPDPPSTSASAPLLSAWRTEVHDRANKAEESALKFIWARQGKPRRKTRITADWMLKQLCNVPKDDFKTGPAFEECFLFPVKSEEGEKNNDGQMVCSSSSSSLCILPPIDSHKKRKADNK